MNITVRQLRAFLAVAEHGSFTRAAKALHITQSAASGLLRELETELGARLFDRTTRRVEPTEAGLELQTAAARVMSDLDDAIQGVRELVERKRGRVIVAAPPLLAATVLPAVIANHRTRFPGIRVVTRDMRTDAILAAVRSGEADCGVGTFHANEDAIASTGLASDRLMLFAPRDHRLAGSATVQWRELDGAELIALTPASTVRTLIDRTLDDQGIAAPPAFEVDQMATAVAMVEAGLGLAILPEYAGAFARLFAIAAVPLVDPVVTREIAFISRKGRSLTEATQSFLEVLRDGVRSHPVVATSLR